MSLDAAFKALADRSRRKLLDRLFETNGQTLNELCVGQRMTRQAVTKHLAVLERANLVNTVWRGREKLHYLNPVPIQEIADRNHMSVLRSMANQDDLARKALLDFIASHVREEAELK